MDVLNGGRELEADQIQAHDRGKAEGQEKVPDGRRPSLIVEDPSRPPRQLIQQSALVRQVEIRIVIDVDAELEPGRA
jgi:hypothetical protein